MVERHEVSSEGRRGRIEISTKVMESRQCSGLGGAELFDGHARSLGIQRAAQVRNEPEGHTAGARTFCAVGVEEEGREWQRES